MDVTTTVANRSGFLRAECSCGWVGRRWNRRFDADKAEVERAAHAATPHAEPEPVDNSCRGGVCIDINRLCSRHSMEYQTRWGRASNE